MEELDKCTLDVESGIQLKLNPEPRDGDQKARTQVGHVRINPPLQHQLFTVTFNLDFRYQEMQTLGPGARLFLSFI